jgi:hypothetical protein
MVQKQRVFLVCFKPVLVVSNETLLCRKHQQGLAAGAASAAAAAAVALAWWLPGCPKYGMQRAVAAFTVN